MPKLPFYFFYFSFSLFSFPSYFLFVSPPFLMTLSVHSLSIHRPQLLFLHLLTCVPPRSAGRRLRRPCPRPARQRIRRRYPIPGASLLFPPAHPRLPPPPPPRDPPLAPVALPVGPTREVGVEKSRRSYSFVAPPGRNGSRERISRCSGSGAGAATPVLGGLRLEPPVEPNLEPSKKTLILGWMK
jgi:hypothetical protein